MAEAFVELGAEAVNHLTEKHWDRGYDTVSRKLGYGNAQNQSQSQSQTQNQYPAQRSRDVENTAPSATSGGKRRRQKNRLPSPEGDTIESYDKTTYRDTTRNYSSRNRETSLDRQSELSEQVIRAYEQDPRDPTRKPESVLSHKDLNRLRKDSRMSYANGPLAPGGGYGQQSQRPQSAQPPRTRYADEYDDDDGSDYDDRNGRRSGATGRGYDDRYDDDQRGYGREIIETERYRGPARDYDGRRQSFRGNDPYGPGAVTQYNRGSRQEVDDYQSRRSQSRGSRGRRNSERDRSRSRSYSRSRSRSGDRSLRDKVESHFDTSLQGLGVGLAGAVVGGMAGRHFSERNRRHKNRDIFIGALVGGLGANAAETKWKGYMDEKKDKVREDEDKWEQGYDNRGYGRSRSAMR